MLKWLPALALLGSPAPQTDCRVDPVIIRGTQVYADALNSGVCYLSVGLSHAPRLVYRSYAVFSDGLLMAFESYGDGEDVGALTAAREFYFFPRSSRPAFELDAEAGRIEAILPNGDRLSFDPDTAQPKSIGRGQVAVQPTVDPAHQGGISFPVYGGLMLEAGYARGRSPSSVKTRESEFRDGAGSRCRVRNEEIFVYTPDGEHAFRFDDASLFAWLRERCPDLKF